MKKQLIVISTALMLCAALAFAAAIDGTWTNSAGAGQVPQTLALHASGSVLTGNVDGVGVTGAKIEGSSVWFSYVRSGVTYTYKGTVNGGSLTLYESRPGVAGTRAVQFARTGN